jgi:hypothetical protein
MPIEFSAQEQTLAIITIAYHYCVIGIASDDVAASDEHYRAGAG